MKSDFAILKSKYGENFAKMCRTLFPTILEQPGTLPQIIEKHFAPTHSLAEDLYNANLIEDFKTYIYDLYQPTEKSLTQTTTTPEALMAQAGYILYPECQTEADIQSFKKYFNTTYHEELCTFNGGRLDTNRVWFAVKNNADQLHREDFHDPERQDEYGTSVISIQFSRNPRTQTLSIKNRYNHTVKYPDATFSNNLDNIIPGLTAAFAQTYGCRNLNTHAANLEIPGYVLATDRKFYRENIENNGISFCENNILIKNGYPYFINTDAQILAENYLINFRENTISDLSDRDVLTIVNDQLHIDSRHPYARDSFVKSLGPIKKICVNKNKATNGKKITIYVTEGTAPRIIELDKHHQIIGYTNPDLTTINGCFLNYNRALKELNTPNVTQINDGCLIHNEALTQLNFPKLTNIGHCFLTFNRIIDKVNMPNLKTIGDAFLLHNHALPRIHIPKVTTIGVSFLDQNQIITKILLPNVKTIGDNFLNSNNALTSIDISNVQTIGNNFLASNRTLRHLDISKATTIGDLFLYYNRDLEAINLPEIKKIGNDFLTHNTKIINIDFPKITTIGKYFLLNNQKVTTVNLPNVKEIGSCFLYNNQALTTLSLPKVINIGENFLFGNQILNSLQLPAVDEIGESSLITNTNLTAATVNLKKGVKIINPDFFLHANPERQAIMEKLTTEAQLNEPKILGTNKLHSFLLKAQNILQNINHPENLTPDIENNRQREL